MFSVF